MIDPYTKAVLTVIAAALVMLAAQNVIGRSSAQFNQVQKVQICDSTDGALVAKIGGNSGLAVIPLR